MGVVDKLSYEIFSLLKTNFLLCVANGCLSSSPETPERGFLDGGRVRVLSIDGCGAGAEDALPAAAALACLEAQLREQAGGIDARVADFFDVAAGPGAGGCSRRCSSGAPTGTHGTRRRRRSHSWPEHREEEGLGRLARVNTMALFGYSSRVRVRASF
jgi:hypothetical protein